MTMHPLFGHETEQERVLQAIKEDRLPQTVLLVGPQGVGKQRFGLWLAQAVLCERDDRPCGACRACIQVQGLGHPDLHWLMPVARPKAAEPEKQVEELGQAIGEVLAERRGNSLYGPPDGLAGHFVATARLLQRHAALTPAVGKRKVFLLAEADRLVPQEANPEAANALLKLLEEPPADTLFVLTVVDANRLLPTIRSRSVPLRLRRLPDAQVREFLGSHGKLSSSEVERRVAAAGGSIGRALALGNEDAKPVRAAEELIRAVGTGPAARAEKALKQGPWAARGDFTAMLDALAETLGEAVRAAAGAGNPMPDAMGRPRSVEALLAAQAKVSAAREAAQGNVNPQLLLATLADDLAEVL